MPIEVIVHPNTSNTIRFDFRGPWTWDKLVAAAQTDAQRMRPSQDPTYFVLNFLPDSTSPGLGIFPFARDLMQRVVERIAHVYIVAQIPIVRFMATTFCRMYTHLGKRITVVATLEDAENAIRRQQGTP